MTSGITFDIKRFALHDGPGLRTTVFVKGCPMSCLGCHNPEGQAVGPELLYRPDRCTACGDCVPVCPHTALRLEGDGIRVDRDRCELEGPCVEVCLPGALEMVGRRRSVEEVLELLEADRIYFDESRGGVTVSGGEPFAQPDFLREILVGCRERELPVVLDTCGHVEPPVFRETAPLATGLLFDLKLMDGKRHEAFTGVHNRWVLENLHWAGGGVPGSGGSAPPPDLTVRIPLIPGINDDGENLEAAAAFLADLPAPPPVDLLPYHRLGVDKYARLGREYGLHETAQPPAARVADAVRRLRAPGLTVTVRGEAHGND